MGSVYYTSAHISPPRFGRRKNHVSMTDKAGYIRSLSVYPLGRAPQAPHWSTKERVSSILLLLCLMQAG